MSLLIHSLVFASILQRECLMLRQRRSTSPIPSPSPSFASHAHGAGSSSVRHEPMSVSNSTSRPLSASQSPAARGHTGHTGTEHHASRGQEPSRQKERDRGRDKDSYRDKNRDRERARDRDRERERDRGRSREREQERRPMHASKQRTHDARPISTINRQVLQIHSSPRQPHEQQGHGFVKQMKQPSSASQGITLKPSVTTEWLRQEHQKKKMLHSAIWEKQRDEHRERLESQVRQSKMLHRRQGSAEDNATSESRLPSHGAQAQHRPQSGFEQDYARVQYPHVSSQPQLGPTNFAGPQFGTAPMAAMSSTYAHVAPSNSRIDSVPTSESESLVSFLSLFSICCPAL